MPELPRVQEGVERVCGNHRVPLFRSHRPRMRYSPSSSSSVRIHEGGRQRAVRGAGQAEEVDRVVGKPVAEERVRGAELQVVQGGVRRTQATRHVPGKQRTEAESHRKCDHTEMHHKVKS